LKNGRHNGTNRYIAAEVSFEESAQEWATFYLGELDAEDEVYFTEKYPEVMKARSKMSPEQFTTWFFYWANQKRQQNRN
jgi:hypothetical protein